MKFEILTIFPDFFRGPLDYGIVRRAREAGLIEIGIQDLRAFTHDRHRTVDDRPFGGGEGMVLKPEPIFECLEALGVSQREERLQANARETVVLLSPQGRLFTQTVLYALALARLIAGNIRLARMPMIASTTSNSITVKAGAGSGGYERRHFREIVVFIGQLDSSTR